MNDLIIRDIVSLPLEKPDKGVANSSNPFSDFKKALAQSVDEVDRLQKEAGEKAEAMILGKADIHQAMIAMEQAGISFRFLIQIRNKMIAAYEEIMRMQF